MRKTSSASHRRRHRRLLLRRLRRVNNEWESEKSANVRAPTRFSTQSARISSCARSMCRRWRFFNTFLCHESMDMLKINLRDVSYVLNIIKLFKVFNYIKQFQHTKLLRKVLDSLLSPFIEITRQFLLIRNFFSSLFVTANRKIPPKLLVHRPAELSSKPIRLDPTMKS